MFLVAIIAGLVVWGIVGSTLGMLVLHKNEAGILPGLVAGIWAAWPFMHQGRVQRYNFLHPVPKRYKVPVKIAFKKVRDILSETTYNFGDKWQVPTAETQQRRIHALLAFSDEAMKMDVDGRGHVHTRTEREKRILKLDVQMKDEGNSTVIQLDFDPRVEGSSFFACDSIIEKLLRDVESALGAGSNAGDPAATSVPAPPWWLLGVTALFLLIVFGDVWAAVFH